MMRFSVSQIQIPMSIRTTWESLLTSFKPPQKERRHTMTGWEGSCFHSSIRSPSAPPADPDPLQSVQRDFRSATSSRFRGNQRSYLWSNVPRSTWWSSVWDSVGFLDLLVPLGVSSSFQSSCWTRQRITRELLISWCWTLKLKHLPKIWTSIYPQSPELFDPKHFCCLINI